MAQSFRNKSISVWFIPLVYVTAAFLLGFTVPRLNYHFFPGLASTISVNAAIGIYSSVASGMLALTGIVFSLTFVMVQFSATAYSPRLVVWIARAPLMSHAIGNFTATFLFAISALAWVDRGGSGRVPIAGIAVVTALLIVSIVLFIALIQRVGMLRVTKMLIFAGDRGREVIELLYPPIETPPSVWVPVMSQSRCTQAIIYAGHPQIVQSVNIEALVALATKADCVIELVPAVGDAVLDSTPVLRILGGNSPIPEESLRSAVEVGDERTFQQDPKYAIRLLVDIAIKALSPAINDPTSAVQALDQIEDLLIRLGRRRLEIGAFSDLQGKPRLLVSFPAWDDFLRLAYDETRFYGANSIQVMRRMKALVNELVSVLPEERRPALDYWQKRIQSTVERTFSDYEDKRDASDEDRQGLGSARRKVQTN